MDLQLSVLVRTDPDGGRVHLVTAGCLTETNQQALYPLVRHAWALTSKTEVIIDLTSVDHIQAHALDLLRWELEQEGSGPPLRLVHFLLPEPSGVDGPGSR